MKSLIVVLLLFSCFGSLGDQAMINRVKEDVERDMKRLATVKQELSEDIINSLYTKLSAAIETVHESTNHNLDRIVEMCEREKKQLEEQLKQCN